MIAISAVQGWHKGYRIIECAELERILKDHGIQLLALNRTNTKRQIGLGKKKKKKQTKNRQASYSQRLILPNRDWNKWYTHTLQAAYTTGAFTWKHPAYQDKGYFWWIPSISQQVTKHISLSPFPHSLLGKSTKINTANLTLASNLFWLGFISQSF